MKISKAIVALLFVPIVNICVAEGLRLSDPVETGEGFEVFGAPMANKSEAPGLSTWLEAQNLADNSSIRVTAQISQVCQKKGCFFIAIDGDHWARVTFRDYAFFVPTDSAGKSVVLEGEITQRHVTQTELAHYAEDLGEKQKVTAPEFEYSIVAHSVLVRND